jgi:hypothetical protein
LLTPEEELSSCTDSLNRQEIIALINTLHQFTKSVMFANSVSERIQQQSLTQSNILPLNAENDMTDEQFDSSSGMMRDYTMYHVI